ncbi:hypothetical protein [Bradyrhizobium arachidis]|uniref:hypothetical protein n=1 Tax=Bradyrhizobium arachidis TaxID=858423 RepID=UPI00216317D9|nr:hypothetical protein [Bradyrhizobium arachidis]UVO26948.1 hypothetical protein KUF59_30985 [Bradyrhizobium arachidis]
MTRAPTPTARTRRDSDVDEVRGAFATSNLSADPRSSFGLRRARLDVAREHASGRLQHDGALRVKEHHVNLRMPYHQVFKRPRCRKEQTVVLTEAVPILIREIDPSEAPIAYRIHTQDEYVSERLHEVRSYESTFLWPLMAPDGPVSVTSFVELAAEGRLGSFIAFCRSEKFGRKDGRTFVEFVNEFPTYKYGDSNKDDQILKTLRGSARLAFCDGYVFVSAGAPIWYVAEKPTLNRVDVLIGHEALDRKKTYVWTAGPDWHMQHYCCTYGHAYGLTEIESEIERVAGRHTEVRFRSRIEILMDLHLPEGAARLCARSLVETVWSYAQNEALRAAVPLLAGAVSVKDVPNDLDSFSLLTQYSRFEDRTLTRSYFSTIAAARQIVRRLEAFGCTPLAPEDDDALGALGS